MDYRIENNILICEIFQVKSPDELVTMDIDTILNKIENTNNAHINILKGYIPSKLFKKIKNVTLGMFYVINPADVNLYRLKKLLTVKLYNEHVNKYLATIIKKRHVELDIDYICDNVPSYLYIIFIEEYVKHEKCWKYYLNNILRIRDDDIFSLFDNSPMTYEKILILMNIPDNVTKYLADKKYLAVVHMWRIIDKRHFVFCKNCVDDKEKFVERTEMFSATGQELINDKIWSFEDWCCKCLLTPLLTIIEDNNRHLAIMDALKIIKI